MYLKVHATPAGRMVALCDAELLGRVLADGSRRLDLQSHRGFYAGRRVSPQEAASALRGAENANIVGARSLRAAAQAGLDTSAAISIAGVPHLQVYRL